MREALGASGGRRLKKGKLVSKGDKRIKSGEFWTEIKELNVASRWECAPWLSCALHSSKDCSHQAPLSMEFFRLEYWSGLPFPFPGDLPDPGIELAPLMSPALAGGFFTTVPSGKAF